MQRVALGRRENTMIRFRWSGDQPKDLYHLDLAVELGAVWEGDELVTYEVEAMVAPMEHMGDDDMFDND